MQQPIRLIVGLGNPGKSYTNTRHNVGVWFVEQLTAQHHVALRPESKFFGEVATFSWQGQNVFLLCPSTFMNRSGIAVKALSNFYRIEPHAILVVHDELDLLPSMVKLKFDGGHAGHNGLRDLINHLGTPQFLRMRIGIGKPPLREQVADFVLQEPTKSERNEINAAIERGLQVVPTLLDGQIEKAMQALHTLT